MFLNYCHHRPLLLALPLLTLLLLAPMQLAPPPLAPAAAGSRRRWLPPPLAPAAADPSISGICHGRAAADSPAAGTPAPGPDAAVHEVATTRSVI